MCGQVLGRVLPTGDSWKLSWFTGPWLSYKLTHEFMSLQVGTWGLLLALGFAGS